ncbi:MAG: bifunctional glutamate N-acetyltransferase/amino-acid acetyltransferase ArgJ [Phycisphaerae bacterium]|jgi:glutamate N-acetyltransferase/amino-acid N-acetyltransferase|nr:bifunctional glutamate N-acetyltransferase/amino-acid acetyltransferase ArgJ [Phycisphaerae bacterium]
MNHARHITLPEGFKAAGVTCGIKASGNRDLAIIASDTDASTAIVTTRNQIVGAPITWCRQILPRGCGKIRGMVINAGVSNVCTGKRGLDNARTMAAETARRTGTDPEKIIVASTGVIGQPLPMSKIKRGIASAANSLNRRADSQVVEAIMTTDTQQKSAVVFTTIGGKKVTIAGIAKGSGMIAPSMATMISVITTDAAISPTALKKALTAAVATSFNAVTVDSDTSTSDIVAVLASGLAGNANITASSKHYRKFASALAEVCRELARAIATDGEGATKLIEVTVLGAQSDRHAEIAAKSVANSPLFKCAVHGCDPNWGRIAMALGKSDAKVVSEKLTIRIGPTRVFSRGTPTKFNAKSVSKHLAGDEVEVVCDLKLGKGRFTALTCDLSRDYITINADYHT